MENNNRMLGLAARAHSYMMACMKTKDYDSAIAVQLDCISHSLAVIADAVLEYRILNGPMEEHHETPDDIADFLGEILGWKEDENDD